MSGRDSYEDFEFRLTEEEGFEVEAGSSFAPPRGHSNDVSSSPGHSNDVSSSPGHSNDVSSSPGRSNDVSSSPGRSNVVSSSPVRLGNLVCLFNISLHFSLAPT